MRRIILAYCPGTDLDSDLALVGMKLAALCLMGRHDTRIVARQANRLQQAAGHSADLLIYSINRYSQTSTNAQEQFRR